MEEQSGQEDSFDIDRIIEVLDIEEDSLDESFDLDRIIEVLDISMSDSPEKNSEEEDSLDESFDLDRICRYLEEEETLKELDDRGNHDCDLYSNTDWVEKQEERRISDFVDLNEGEMNFFKLWNRHMRSLSGVGVTHMPAVLLR